MTNDTCVKSSIPTQSYKVISTRAMKSQERTILYLILHSRATNLGGTNGDVQSDLATLAFKKIEQLEDFHIIILILQHEIMISGETFSPTRLLFQFMKALSKSEKIK